MYVYILRSKSRPEQRYVGVTTNLEERLIRHNAGESYHTAKYMPWEIETSIHFSDPAKALRFEIYLKSGSGLAFRNRHF